jgi:tetratricopeptide (TPR) repeat protein
MNRKVRRAVEKQARKGTNSTSSQKRPGTTLDNGGIGALFAEALRCQQSGQHAQAVEFYDRINARNPELAEVHCNRGVALTAIGRFADAETAYQRAIALRPDLAQAYSNLGELLRRVGRYDEAVRTLTHAVALNPSYAEAFSNLGNALKDQGRLRDAELAHRTAVRLTPHAAQAHNNLGAVLCDRGKLDEAEQALRHALTLAPGFLEAYLNLCTVLKQQGRFGEAEMTSRRVLEINPDHAETHCSLGGVLVKLDKLHDAEIAYRRAIALKPSMPEAHYNLGVTLKFLGRLDEARAAIARAVQLAPRKTIYLHSLSEFTRFAADDPHLAAMENLLSDAAALAPEQQINLHFAVAKAYDDLGRHDDSFHHLRAGNAIKRGTVAYDEAATLSDIARTGELFSAELMRKLEGGGATSAIPIFIVGIPRSGSTLIEQILASHPQVCGGGELPHFADAVAEIANGCGVSFPDFVTHLSGDAPRQLGERYLAATAPLAPAAARFIDKTLSNFLHVGLIHLALPQARIIHAVRDPAATCLSCFSKVFVSGQLYSYDLGELGRLYRHYQALMDHWHRVLPPGRILDVHYEDVVADLEGQSRRMLAHCGLDWDERCLDFHTTERPVFTASSIQVRQPLYRAALDRVQHYRRHLAPLFAELSGEETGALHSVACGGVESCDAT